MMEKKFYDYRHVLGLASAGWVGLDWMAVRCSFLSAQSFSFINPLPLGSITKAQTSDDGHFPNPSLLFRSSDCLMSELELGLLASP
jgi:hypothetical protein